MGIASYLRFFIGLALSIEIIRNVLFGGKISDLAIMLSVSFIGLSLLFFFQRFFPMGG